MFISLATITLFIVRSLSNLPNDYFTAANVFSTYNNSANVFSAANVLSASNYSAKVFSAPNSSANCLAHNRMQWADQFRLYQIKRWHKAAIAFHSDGIIVRSGWLLAIQSPRDTKRSFMYKSFRLRQLGVPGKSKSQAPVRQTTIQKLIDKKGISSNLYNPKKNCCCYWRRTHVSLVKMRDQMKLLNSNSHKIFIRKKH